MLRKWETFLTNKDYKGYEEKSHYILKNSISRLNAFGVPSSKTNVSTFARNMKTNAKIPKFDTEKLGPISERDQITFKEIAQKLNVPREVIGIFTTALKAANGVDFANGIEMLTMLTKFMGTAKDASNQLTRDTINPHYYTYHTAINSPPTEAKYLANAYHYRKSKRVLLDTEVFSTATKPRKVNLFYRCGFNQKLILIFNHSSFLTFQDLIQLTKCEEAVKEALLKRKKFTNKKILPPKEGVKNLYPITDPIGKIHALSFINRVETKLTISNDSKSYKNYTKVYLCQMKSYTNCANRYNKTVDEIIRTMDEELKDPLRSSVKQTQVLHPIPVMTDNTEFAREIFLSTDASITKFQCFQENINILQTYQFTLRPSDKGIINVRHNFPYACDLIELNRYAENDENCPDPNKRSTCASTLAPALTFFIIESLGSNGAEIRHRTDRGDRQTGTAPLEIRIAEEIVIYYKRDQNEVVDQPVYEVAVDEYDTMITSEYEQNFQTLTSVPYNKDINDIDLDGTNPNADYILSVDNNSLVNFGDIVRARLNDPSVTDREAEQYRDRINRDNDIPVIPGDNDLDESNSSSPSIAEKLFKSFGRSINDNLTEDLDDE